MIMNISTGIKQAAILAIGIIALGYCIKSGLEGLAGKDRKVVVKGLSEKEVEADKVTWPILSKEIGNDLPNLYQTINHTTSTIRQFLLANGVKESEINVNAPVVIDLNAERYGDNRQPYRYNITSIITVTSNNVKLIRSLIARQGELLQKGIAIVDGGYDNPVKYEYVAFRKMKPKMMEEAIANAEQVAFNKANKPITTQYRGIYVLSVSDTSQRYATAPKPSSTNFLACSDGSLISTKTVI